MFGFWNSASAISAAFFIDCAATPALPDADSGRASPTLTCPLPAPPGCCPGPAGADGASEFEENGLENWLRLCWTLEQAESRGAPSNKPSAVRRVALWLSGPVASFLGLDGPTIASLVGINCRHFPA